MIGLKRKLSVLDSILFVIGGVIGSGIFLTTGFIANYLPSPLWIIIIWVTGGIITISGALSFAEMGAMFPKSGGQYIYLREAYKPWTAFLYGWGFFWVIECGGIAALAVGFAEYLSYFLPSFSTKKVWIELCQKPIDINISAGQIVAIAAIIILSFVNYFGIKSGMRVQNIFTFLRILAIVFLVVFGLSIGEKSGIQNFSHFFKGINLFNIKFFGLALIAALWTYDGWYSVSCTAEEIKKPEKNIPLGLALGALVVIILYLAINFIYIIALPMSQMRGLVRIGEAASTQLLGREATHIFSGIVAITIFGCLSSTIIYGPRVYLAMARDGLFFKNMAYIHPRYHVPSRAITGQMIWSCLLCLIGSYQSLFEYVVFALVLFFAATGVAVIILRFKMPEKERPYRVWGYPFLPLLFSMINLAIFINTIWSQPIKSLIGTGILLAGVPAYFLWKRKQSILEEGTIK